MVFTTFGMRIWVSQILWDFPATFFVYSFITKPQFWPFGSHLVWPPSLWISGWGGCLRVHIQRFNGHTKWLPNGQKRVPIVYLYDYTVRIKMWREIPQNWDALIRLHEEIFWELSTRIIKNRVELMFCLLTIPARGFKLHWKPDDTARSGQFLSAPSALQSSWRS